MSANAWLVRRSMLNIDIPLASYNPWAARMEMGSDHHGFCSGITKDNRRIRCYLGRCRSVDQVSPLHTDHGHLFGGMTGWVIRRKHYPSSWGFHLHNFRLRRSIHFAVLEVHQTSTWDPTQAQYGFPPTNRWSIWDNYPNARRYVKELHYGLRRIME